MKKTIKLISIIVITLFALNACNKENPQNAVNEYVSLNKEGKSTSIKEYALDLIYPTHRPEGGVPKEVINTIDNFIANIDTEILSEEINKDNAKVELQVKGVNFIKEGIKINKERLDAINKGTYNPTEDITITFKKAIENGEIETRKRIINLTKVDKGWQVNKEDINKVILGVDKTMEMKLYLSEVSQGGELEAKELSIEDSLKYVKKILGDNIEEVKRVYEEEVGVDEVTYKVDKHLINVRYIYPYKTKGNETLNEYDKTKTYGIYFSLEK